jgi:hypothetical protein
VRASVSSGGKETIAKPTRHILATLLLGLTARSAVAGRAADECLGSWRIGEATGNLGNVSISCRDGDPSCDADGVADGVCRIRAAFCLNAPGCAPGALGPVALRGAAGAAIAAQAAALAYPVGGTDVCTTPADLSVALGHARRRRATVQARVRDEAAGRSDADRLRVTCLRASAGGKAIIASTDFETGMLATVSVRPPRRVEHPDAQIHSDAVIRVSGGMVFVVNRFLGDNIQRLDPAQGFRTRFQCSTGNASNPQDLVVVAPDKAYVTRYDRPELWVVDPSVGGDCAGFRRGVIDLSAFADGDGLPEMDQMAVVEGRLFVTVQRLDRRRGFAPTGPSRVVVIDVATDTVIGDIELHGSDPFGDASSIVREPGTGRLVFSSVGNIYVVGDGGLERVDPFTLQAEGRFFVDENQLGGNVLDFVLLSPTKGYAILQDADLQNRLVDFDPTNARPPRTLYRRQAYLPDIALGPDGLLWLADQGLPDPGIELFNTTTDKPVLRQPMGVGLPPFSIGFLP